MGNIVRDPAHALHKRFHLLQHLVHDCCQSSYITLLARYLEPLAGVSAYYAGNLPIQLLDLIQKGKTGMIKGFVIPGSADKRDGKLVLDGSWNVGLG